MSQHRRIRRVPLRPALDSVSHKYSPQKVCFRSALYYNFFMIQTVSGALEKFQNSVGIKFQLYNSLFLSLPFYGVDKTGILLSLFNTDCEEGYTRGKSPEEIIEDFFENNSEAEKLDFLFR